ncbi:2-dehydro-3-deoxygalactonokinase [Siccibacter turicensis]|uniref:2-dehydro-3-deoxygalactonokinase n=1 Tax=Siccibacter turicensis TaxID=357233 RepID=A0A2P8VH14_9ENTR|nr:2-dehydro-3-deoxygalactonokinase [Siccibacter turicensis]PSN06855.1 2-dehydro-3-deoxygalactonokinase [Siccibacter turicensis]
MKTNWIAVDWGTTNFRAFLMRHDAPLAELHQPCGLLSVEHQRFAATLQTLLAPWLQAYGALPIVMAGMVGSQQGWFDVPYAPLPAGMDDLLARLFAFTTPWGSPAWIVPGINGRSHYGLPDVMRGEEVQLLGLHALQPTAEHDVLLPGTHCKHARMIKGEIVHFSTFMTGELFSLLSQHSILGRDLPAQQDDDAAFLAGVRTASLGAPFSHLIFSARTRRLAGELPEPYIHSYLSGLTIGYELLALTPGQHVWVIGSPALTTRYRMAGRQMCLELHPVEGNLCFIRGLSELFLRLQGATS